MSDPVEVVRRFSDAYARADWAAAWELQSPDAELVLPASHPEAGTYRGREEISAYFRRWLGTWAEYQWTLDRVVAEADRVAVLAHERGRGKGSGARTEVDPGIVYTVRDGVVVRTEIYMTWDEALAALSR